MTAPDIHQHHAAAPKAKWGEAEGRWIETRAETVATLLVGIAAAFLGFFGVLKGDKLSSAILAVLVVFAGALIVERERRVREARRVDKILEEIRHIPTEIERTGDAVRVLASPTPYHVVVNDSYWDIEQNGDAIARRAKRLRFSQDEVIAVTDSFRGEGSINAVEYKIGSAPGKPVHEFPSGGRACTLVALDRVYMREEEQDFVVVRKNAGMFPKSPDRIWASVLESTSLLRITIRWSDRLPAEVRTMRQTAGALSRPKKYRTTPLADGRAEFRLEIPEPEIGDRYCVEWDW